MFQKRALSATSALGVLLALVVAGTAGASVLVGSNIDVIQPGALNGGDQNKLQQNEPFVAIDPNNTSVLAAGANDYRRSRFVTPASVWMGYYRSTNGGSTWSNSLVPGFPGDASAAGLASPAHGLQGASDPVGAFDRNGNLYYSFIAFNAGGFPDVPGPLQETGVFVAKYTADGATYDSTATVAFSGASFGIFDDKNWIAVDQNAPADSPFSGRVYTCWTRFIGSAPPPTSLFGGDRIMFSYSSDGGQRFSQPHNVSDRGAGGSILNQDCQIAVAADGTVYVAYVTFASNNVFGPTANGISLTKSSDGGRTFSKPTTVATFDPVPRNNGTRDCCAVYGFRTARSMSLAVDSSGKVYVAYFADSNPAANFDGSGNVLLANIDADVYVGVSSNGGSTFTVSNVTMNNVQGGADEDEVFPALTAAGSRVEVAYYTDVNDPNQADDNQPSLALNNGGPGPQALTDVYDSVTTNGGTTWTPTRVTNVSANSSWPMFVGGTLPFHGDYIGAASSGNTTHVIWTDDRNVIFNDPDLSTPGVEANNTGNRDQEIYTATLTYP